MAGKISELSILEQVSGYRSVLFYVVLVAQGLAVEGIAWLAICDGARHSTHSSIIGADLDRLPEYGSFESVDSRLIGLGARRQPAIDQLEHRAIDFLDVILPSFSDEEDEKKLMLVWLYTSIIDSNGSKSWCRSVMGASTRLAAKMLRRPNLDSTTRARVAESAYYIVVSNPSQAFLAVLKI